MLNEREIRTEFRGWLVARANQRIRCLCKLMSARVKSHALALRVAALSTHTTTRRSQPSNRGPQQPRGRKSRTRTSATEAGEHYCKTLSAHTVSLILHIPSRRTYNLTWPSSSWKTSTARGTGCLVFSIDAVRHRSKQLAHGNGSISLNSLFHFCCDSRCILQRHSYLSHFPLQP